MFSNHIYYSVQKNHQWRLLYPKRSPCKHENIMYRSVTYFLKEIYEFLVMRFIPCLSIKVVVVLLFYVQGKQLRSGPNSQLT